MCKYEYEELLHDAGCLGGLPSDLKRLKGMTYGRWESRDIIEEPLKHMSRRLATLDIRESVKAPPGSTFADSGSSRGFRVLWKLRVDRELFINTSSFEKYVRKKLDCSDML